MLNGVLFTIAFKVWYYVIYGSVMLVAIQHLQFSLPNRRTAVSNCRFTCLRVARIYSGITESSDTFRGDNAVNSEAVGVIINLTTAGNACDFLLGARNVLATIVHNDITVSACVTSQHHNELINCKQMKWRIRGGFHRFLCISSLVTACTYQPMNDLPWIMISWRLVRWVANDFHSWLPCLWTYESLPTTLHTLLQYSKFEVSCANHGKFEKKSYTNQMTFRSPFY